MTIYLDASVLVALIGAEDGSQAAIDFVGNATEQLVVSDFAIGEVASAISRLVRMGKIDSTAGVERLDIFDEWTATVATALPTGESDIRLATQLVRRFSLGVRMPDAIHLASAQIRGFKLATIDRRMAMNAEQLRMDFVVPAGQTG